MPFKIQRVPRALNNLLGITGGLTPTELEDRVHGSLDLLQVYGAPQRILLQGNSAALAEGPGLVLDPAALAQLNGVQWYLLYGMAIRVSQTATLTALELALWLGIQPAGYRVATKECTQFGATVTGNKSLAWYAPYPVLLASNVQPFATADIIGTDANVNATLSVDLALLG